MGFFDEFAKITKYDLVLGADRKIANLTADLLRKTPLGKKDPILKKQEDDTAHGGYSAEQTKNQTVVAGTVAATVLTAGAAGKWAAAVAAPVAKVGQAEILASMRPPAGIAGDAAPSGENSFDNGAMKTALDKPPAAKAAGAASINEKTILAVAIPIAMALLN